MPHSHVIPRALAGKDYTSSAFSTNRYREGFSRLAPYFGQLPPRLCEVLDARFRAGAIRQVIYSYSTPIAWLDCNVWIVPDVRYSITTSSKHQVHLYKLPNRRTVVWDTPLDEYLRVLNGLMVYRGGRTFPSLPRVGDTIRTWQGTGKVSRVGSVSGFYIVNGHEIPWHPSEIY